MSLFTKSRCLRASLLTIALLVLAPTPKVFATDTAKPIVATKPSGLPVPTLEGYIAIWGFCGDKLIFERPHDDLGPSDKHTKIISPQCPPTEKKALRQLQKITSQYKDNWIIEYDTSQPVHHVIGLRIKLESQPRGICIPDPFSTGLRVQRVASSVNSADKALVHLKQFPKLRWLDLSGSAITGTGLAELSGLPELQELHLSHCHDLTDAGLACLKKLKGLRRLNLHHIEKNQLAGLKHICELKELRTLDLSRNYALTEKHLISLKKLKKLRALNLSGTDLRGLEGLKFLTQLEVLILPSMTNTNMVHLKNLTNLKFLNLSESRNLTKVGLAHLKNLTNLETVALPLCGKVTDDCLAFLKGMKKLWYLDLLGCNQLTNKGIAHLKGLENLHAIILDGYDINEECLSYLSALPRLQSLDLHMENRLSCKGIKQLEKMPQLQQFTLNRDSRNDAGLTEKELNQLVQLPHLRSLDLRVPPLQIKSLKLMKSPNLVLLTLWKCHQLTTFEIGNFPKLRSLTIHDNKQLKTIKLTKTPLLESVSFSSSPHLTDALFGEIKKLKYLNDFSVGGAQLTDAGLAQLVGMKKLKRISLSSMQLITKTGLQQLTKLKSLETISLLYAPKITHTDLQCFKGLPKLKTLHISGMPKITYKEFRTLQKQLPKCDVKFPDP